MLPINQQNLAFLSISSDNSIENNNIGVDGDSLLGFENLFTAYTMPLQDENIAALDQPDLPLSVFSSEQVQADDVSPGTAFLPLASLLSPVDSSNIDNSSTENIPLPSVLQNDITVQVSASNYESVPYENNINSYLTSVITSTADTQQSNEVETTVNNQLLQSNSNQSVDIDLATLNVSVNTSASLQRDSKVSQPTSASTSPSLQQPLNNSLPSLSQSLGQTDIETASIKQENTINIDDENHNSSNHIAQKTDREVPSSLKPNDALSNIAPLADPATTNIAASAHIATQNTKINSVQNTQTSSARVAQPTSKIESENLSNQSAHARPIELNQQEAQADFSANNYVNRNNAQISSIEVAADDKTFEPSSLANSLEGVTEQKTTVTTSNAAIQGDDNSQQTVHQTLLSINKATGLNSSPVELTSTSDITNSNEIAKQLVLAQQNGTQQIRLLITPEHLGAVDISIQDAKEGVNIQIVTHNLGTKESLEAFMPRLREMLEQSGVNIQDTSIEHKQQNSDSSFGSDYQQANQDKDNKISQKDGADIQDQSQIITNISVSDHILDAFA